MRRRDAKHGGARNNQRDATALRIALQAARCDGLADGMRGGGRTDSVRCGSEADGVVSVRCGSEADGTTHAEYDKRRTMEQAWMRIR